MVKVVGIVVGSSRVAAIREISKLVDMNSMLSSGETIDFHVNIAFSTSLLPEHSLASDFTIA